MFGRRLTELLGGTDLRDLRRALDAVPDDEPVSEELAAARIEFAEADRKDRRIQAAYRDYPPDEVNAARQAKTAAARRVWEIEQAEREAARLDRLAASREAARPVLDQAAVDLNTVEGKLAKAAQAAQAALDAAWAAADEYEAIRIGYAAELHRAGVAPVDGQDGSDGKAVRVKGRTHVPAPPAVVVEWLAWRTLPRGPVMTPPMEIGAMLRGAWTLNVGPPSHPEPKRPVVPRIAQDALPKADVYASNRFGVQVPVKDLTDEDRRLLQLGPANPSGYIPGVPTGTGRSSG